MRVILKTILDLETVDAAGCIDLVYGDLRRIHHGRTVNGCSAGGGSDPADVELVFSAALTAAGEHSDRKRRRKCQ